MDASAITFPEYEPPRIGKTYRPDASDLLNVWIGEMTPATVAGAMSAAEQGDQTRQVQLIERVRETDLHLAGVSETRRLALIGLPWEIVPAHSWPGAVNVDETASQDAADYCAESLARMARFDAALTILAEALDYGCAAAEIVWTIEPGGYHRPSGLWSVQQESLVTDSLATWKLRIRTKDSGYTGLDVAATPYKWIVNHPRGVGPSLFRGGLMRAALPYVCYKRYGLQWWVSYCEIFGIPWRVGTYPENVQPDVKAKLDEIFTEKGALTDLLLPFGSAVTFQEASGNSGKVFAELAAKIDEWFSILYLGQTLTTAIGATGGAYAAAQVHDRVRRDLLKHDIANEAEVLRSQLLMPMVRFGPQPDAPVPYFRRVLEEPKDVGMVLDNIRRAQDVGLIIPKGWAYGQAGIPMPEDEDADDTLEPKTKPPSPFGFPATAKAAATEAPSRKPTTHLEALEGWIAETADAAQQVAKAALDTFAKQIDEQATDKAGAREAVAKSMYGLPYQKLIGAFGDYAYATMLVGRWAAKRQLGKLPQAEAAQSVEREAGILRKLMREGLLQLEVEVGASPADKARMRATAKQHAAGAAGNFTLRLAVSVDEEIDDLPADASAPQALALVEELADDQDWLRGTRAEITRSLRTLSARAYNAEHFATMQDAGVEAWTWRTYVDPCNVCQGFDGMTFGMDHTEPYPGGVHPNCACFAEPLLGAEPDITPTTKGVRDYRRAVKAGKQYPYDPARFAKPEPLSLKGVPPKLREHFRRAAKQYGIPVKTPGRK